MTTPLQPTEPTPDSYTLHDWIQILQNAAKVPADHPRYAEAQAAINGPGGAKENINAMLQQQSMADQEAPNKTLGRIATFGNAAGLGIPGKLFSETGQYVSQERQNDPMGSTVADLGGTAAIATLLARLGAPLTAGMSPGAQGALVGGATGATRGGVEGGLPGALMGGTLGGFGGLVAGKVAGALSPLASNVKNAIVRALGIGAKGAAEEAGAVGGVTREMLLKAGVAPENVEAQLARIRAGGGVGKYEPPPQVRTQSGGVQTSIPGKPLDEAAARAAGVPPPPNVMAKIGNAPPEKVSLEDFMLGKGAGGTQAGQLATDYRAALRAATDAVGRPLTSAERDAVLQFSMSQGKTLPYYPRGGAAEQAGPAFPQASPQMQGVGMQTPQAQALSAQLAQLLGQR